MSFKITFATSCSWSSEPLYNSLNHVFHWFWSEARESILWASPVDLKDNLERNGWLNHRSEELHLNEDSFAEVFDAVHSRLTGWRLRLGLRILWGVYWLLKSRIIHFLFLISFVRLTSSVSQRHSFGDRNCWFLNLDRSGVHIIVGWGDVGPCGRLFYNSNREQRISRLCMLWNYQLKSLDVFRRFCKKLNIRLYKRWMLVCIPFQVFNQTCLYFKSARSKIFWLDRSVCFGRYLQCDK